MQITTVTPRATSPATAARLRGLMVLSPFSSVPSRSMATSLGRKASGRRKNLRYCGEGRTQPTRVFDPGLRQVGPPAATTARAFGDLTDQLSGVRAAPLGVPADLGDEQRAAGEHHDVRAGAFQKCVGSVSQRARVEAVQLCGAVAETSGFFNLGLGTPLCLRRRQLVPELCVVAFARLEVVLQALHTPGHFVGL